MVSDEERIQCFTIKEYHFNQLFEMHFYTRYIGEHTDLYCFGNGLGDQTCMSQVGDCFLQLMDEGKDPKLGRIIMSFGEGSTSFQNFYGDHIVAWAWGMGTKDLSSYVSRFKVKPELILSPYQGVRNEAEKLGMESLRFWSGVDPRLFKPLGLKREGIGFSGKPKSDEQNRIMLSPAQEYGLDWISKNPNTDYLTIPEYNEWLNSKQIVLGMVAEERHDVTFVPTRLFEALAAGTPLITYKINGVEEHTGIDYPWMSVSRQQTKTLINFMFENYDYVHKQTLEWSDHIRENHSYKTRLLEMFAKLEEK